MIPQSQLVSLKPLTDQVNRKRMVDSKRTIPFRKGRLTKRARQYAFYPVTAKSIKKQNYHGPKGIKSKGNIPMEERKK